MPKKTRGKNLSTACSNSSAARVQFISLSTHARPFSPIGLTQHSSSLKNRFSRGKALDIVVAKIAISPAIRFFTVAVTEPPTLPVLGLHFQTE